ncbi:GNAT family N-acetyltransferase [Acidaminobacterium chupaoyuni]
MIREMTVKDYPIYHKMARRFYNSPAVLHQLPDEIYEKSFHEMVSGSPFIKGYLIEEGEETAGYMILSFTFSAEVGGMVVLVEELYLEDAFRGNGLGSKALDFVRKAYPDAARFRLEVTEENQGAIRLYERMGYQPLEYRQMVIDFTEEEK